MKPTLIHPVLITVGAHKHATGIGKKVCRISKTPVDQEHKPSESKKKNPIEIRLAQVNSGFLNVLFYGNKTQVFPFRNGLSIWVFIAKLRIRFYSYGICHSILNCTVYINQISKATGY